MLEMAERLTFTVLSKPSWRCFIEEVVTAVFIGDTTTQWCAGKLELQNVQRIISGIYRNAFQSHIFLNLNKKWIRISNNYSLLLSTAAT